MKPEFKGADQSRQNSPYAREIEYALVVQRMINAVKDDPQQMRLTIYEFARARLKIDTFGIDESERERLLSSLETAIHGVEQFSLHQENNYVSPPSTIAQITTVSSKMPVPAAEPVLPSENFRSVSPSDVEILVPKQSYARAEMASFGQARSEQSTGTLWRFWVVLLFFGGLGSLIYYNQIPRLPHGDPTPQISSTVIQPEAASTSTSSLLPKSATVQTDPGFPLPTDYGVYALNNQTLDELYALPERVPDKRIAVSTPVDQPSRTNLPDGKVKFIVFRRDIAGIAPERAEIRVVARVVRAISFDAKGKPKISSVSDAWNIRNVSHEFRVRPVSGNSEMLLVQSDKPDFALPAGRYVLVLKDQGYDFTVGGKVIEPAQCLERTDAANGSFYSECLTP